MADILQRHFKCLILKWNIKKKKKKKKKLPPWGPLSLISWWGIALGFPKPQCRRVSPSLTLSRHLYFLATPCLTMEPSSGTLTLWRHNCMASWRKMRRQGEAWQRLWILEFQVSLRYCSSQPVDVHLRSFCRTPNLGSGNSLALSKQQPITWTNDDPVHKHIYVALGGDELKYSRNPL